jgi:scyllo-inositol 2-dehydrogenase (NADP+)
VLYDLGSHMIDQALRLFGRPEWIQADLFRQSDARNPSAEPDDGFELLLGKGRLRVSLAACSFASGPARSCQLDGEAATFMKSGFDPQEAGLKTGADPRSEHFGREPESAWGELLGLKGETERVPSEPGRWTAYYDGVRRAVEEGAPPPVTLGEAAEVIEIIEAAFASWRSGRRISL